MAFIRHLFGCVAVIAVILSSAAGAVGDKPHDTHSFDKTQLTDQFYCEGANYGDFNHDGVMDIESGPYWYAGPKFTERFEIYEPKAFDIANYSENFLSFAYDVNKDGWTDVIVVGFPGKEGLWYENPQGKPGRWPRHVAFDVVDNESPWFTDLTGDGKPEFVCNSGGRFGYAEIPGDDPTKPWTWHAITPVRDYQRFTHGMGVGDVNNDGRMDVLEKDGWWEQPAADSKAETWPFHEVKFSEVGGAQMFAYDVDGDGDNDVITSKAAHAYGLSWFENVPEKDGKITFREHLIMGEKPEENEFGVAFSQLHSLDLIDMDGDGVKDIVTGKRYWAHAEHDPGSLDPPVLYWFQTVRPGPDSKDKAVHFIPHRIDSNSGVGTQVVAGDLNSDGLPDIVVGNKKGTFVFIQKNEAAKVSADAAEKPTADTSVSAKSPTANTGGGEDGFPATTRDGRVLNLDFEKGDLSDWTAEGKAFQGQPIEGDTIHPRRSDSVSGHKGRFWIGTFERMGDDPKGILTSVPFPVTHPYATFLVGGGSGGALGVEVVNADTKEVIFKASGRSQEEMRPAIADLRLVLGKEIYLRVLDRASAGWGHTNFDHFRFHDQKPVIQDTAGQSDDYPYAGLPAEEAAAVMKLPEGFSVTVSAAEPDVKQPIAMAYDDRGRLWVAEAYEYPKRAPEGQGRDRILIFEDADGDGRFDKRTVFAEGLNLVSGLEVGFGGAWVGAAPYLLFIPDRNGDDVPDDKPEVLLDGWADQDTHETLNTFIWGPDGWLYGCHGVFTHSRVGKPGTADKERIPLNAAIWRYHPTRHVFEIFAEGTSNPWGVDFDDHGQAFSTACVIPHLYHIIQGGRYQRQAGNHFNPYTYGDIQTIADHRHYVGDNPHGGNGVSADAGGGHAHCGAMIYLGGLWPEEYRSRIFMNNIHGQRLNTDILKPQGSGFVGSHGPDFLRTGDLASQILNIRYGPDGNAYLIDWYDTNACHHTTVEGHDRSNGRVYKVSYGDAKAKQDAVDLRKLSDQQLADLALEKNDWYVRHARRILQERAAAGNLDGSAQTRLTEIVKSNPDETRRLRAMWALHGIGGLTPELVSTLLNDKNEYVRAWTIQLALDNEKPEVAELLPQLAELAQKDSSPIVRLYLASAALRIPEIDRWNIVEALVHHGEDSGDHNLPLMYWYAAEPLAAVDADRALALGLSCGKTIPLIRDFMLRRIGSLGTPASLAALVRELGKTSDAAEQAIILRGIRGALAGQRRVEPPAEWAAVFKNVTQGDNPEVRSQALALAVTFGDESAMNTFRELIASPQADVKARREAIDALLAAKDSKLVTTLQALLTEPAIRDAALTGLAQYDDPQTAAKILALYGSLTPAEKRAALATLGSRGAYAVEMLKAIEAKQIPTTDVSADLIRQLHNLKEGPIDELLAKVWGQVRSTPADKAELIGSYRKMLTAAPEIQPDLELGRAVFAKTCQQCHTLYGAGTNIGPDLTGSNRADVEYLLSNVVDPSALIAKEYRPTVIVASDGRVITGLLTQEDEKAVTIRTATETLVLPKDEIEERSLSETSMMPDDQLKQFSPHETLSLFAYLRGKGQSPMLATKDTAGLLFNGRDLTGWNGDSRFWSVENGEIVGRSPGLKHNTFLLSDMTVDNFRLSLETKLVNDSGNSGIQFRTVPKEGFEEVVGYQADMGPTWWGKLYEENGRAILSDKSGEEFVKKGEWNRYEIEADGSHIRTWINGQLCVDLDDPDGKRRGIIALQIHSGPAMEVRFRNLKLEVK